MLGRVVDDLADLVQAVDEQGFPLVPPDGGELLNCFAKPRCYNLGLMVRLRIVLLIALLAALIMGRVSDHAARSVEDYVNI